MATISSASLSAPAHGPRRKAALPNSVPSGAPSSPRHSTPTGRNCTTCAAPAPPGAPSTWRFVPLKPTSILHRTMDPCRLCRPLARPPIARDHGALPDGPFPAVIPAMNGPPDDAAALCNSRRLSQSRPQLRGLVQDHGPGRCHRVQPALRVAAEAAASALKDFEIILRDARAHAVSPRAVRGAAEAEAVDHLGHAQRRDRYGGRQGRTTSCCAARNWPAIPTAPLTMGLILELTRNIGRENARMHAGEPWQTLRRHRDRGPHARRHRPRQARHQGLEARRRPSA